MDGTSQTGEANGRLGLVGIRWPAVALAGLVALALIGSWLPGLAGRQGVSSPAGPSDCPAWVGAVSFPDRAGREGLLLPAGYADLAPIDATWCRFDENGQLTGTRAVDAARTSRLAALLVAPPGGWPDDALAAKRIVPLTAAQVEAATAPACSAPSTADLLVFRYAQGSDAAVLVRGEPCADAANGAITLRTPPGVGRALDDLR